MARAVPHASNCEIFDFLRTYLPLLLLNMEETHMAKYGSHTGMKCFGLNKSESKKKLGVSLGDWVTASNQFWGYKYNMKKEMRSPRGNNKSLFNMARKTIFSKDLFLIKNINAGME